MSLNIIRNSPVACLVVLMTIYCAQSEEIFLTWRITNITDNRSTDVYFSKYEFRSFYGGLCDQTTLSCRLTVLSNNFSYVTGLSQSMGETSRSNITRYVCLYELYVQDSRIICTKVDSTDSDICSDTRSCLRYSVNESFLDLKCDLPFIEISLDLAESTYFSYVTVFNNDFVRVSPCTANCLVDTLPPPAKFEPSTTATRTNYTSASSVPPSSNSDLTTKEVFFIGMSIGLIASIIAVVTAAIVVFRRRRRWRERLSNTTENSSGAQPSVVPTTAINDSNNLNGDNIIRNGVNAIYENQLMTTLAVSDNDYERIDDRDIDDIIGSRAEVVTETAVDTYTNTCGSGDNVDRNQNNSSNSNNNNTTSKSNSFIIRANVAYENQIGISTLTSDTNKADNNDGNNDNNSNKDDGYTDATSQQDLLPPQPIPSTAYFNTVLSEDHTQINVSHDDDEDVPSTVSPPEAQGCGKGPSLTDSSSHGNLTQDITKSTYYNEC